MHCTFLSWVLLLGSTWTAHAHVLQGAILSSSHLTPLSSFHYAPGGAFGASLSLFREAAEKPAPPLWLALLEVEKDAAQQQRPGLLKLCGNQPIQASSLSFNPNPQSLSPNPKFPTPIP